MESEPPLKSAFELAMERLAAKDATEGVKPAAPLTAEQKEKITAARQDAQAKLAEIEILHRKEVQGVGGDVAKLSEIDRKHKIDRERIEARVESAIAEIRASGSTKKKS